MRLPSPLSSPLISDPQGRKHTSLALCCIFISLSISANCCSSENASAHGTPSSNALVLTTHSVCPPNLRPADTHDEAAPNVCERNLRCVGGTMSRRAARRSARDSSCRARSSSSSSEASDAVGGCQFSCCIFLFLSLLFREEHEGRGGSGGD